MDGFYIRSIGAAFLAMMSYLFGVFDSMLTALLAFIALDFATGIIKAIVLKGVSSYCMFRGGVKKIGVLVVVAVSNILDVSLELGGTLRTITISYFIANEGISILENWGALGLPIPKRLKDILAQLRDVGEGKKVKHDKEDKEENRKETK